MTEWEKLVDREGDFLKNYLLYENFVENFPKVFNRNHADFLTIRKGNMFSHYMHLPTGRELSKFLKENLDKNSNFVKDVVDGGKQHFQTLFAFAEGINKADFKKVDALELKQLMEQYFELYKEPYPYFNITPYSDELENKQEIIDLMADWRLFARTNWNKVHELIEPLFKEVAERLNLTSDEIKFLKPEEITNLLVGNKSDIAELIAKRQDCYFLLKNGALEFKENSTFRTDEEHATELKGRGTFPAKYQGRVKIVNNPEDVKKLEQGDVLVARMTLPAMITENLRKAGAIITDEGGITCHAAVVSREFRIPALLGTKVATKTLKDDDIVEVDTEKGIVKIIKK